MIQQLDHLVILVEDLERAIDDYGILGFTVAPGGEHSDGATHNALVAFRDGTYLELIAFKRQAPEHRWWRHTVQGEGLIDFALLPSDTAEVIVAARERGLPFDGPTDGGRVRPDGVELRWQTGLPLSHDLPFLCGDRTPRELRVPSGVALVHPNGAVGITSLMVAVANLTASRARYQALLDQPPDQSDSETEGIQTTHWHLGDTKLMLVSSAHDDNGEPTIVQQLAGRGEGPYRCVVGVDHGEQRELDVALTHGVHIRLARA